MRLATDTPQDVFNENHATGTFSLDIQNLSDDDDIYSCTRKATQEHKIETQ